MYRTLAVRVLTPALAGLFVAAGVKALLSPAAPWPFTAGDYPLPFRLFVGALEFAGAILLLVRPLAWRGAGLLGLVLAGAVLTDLLDGRSGLAAVAAAVLGLVALAGYANHPRSSFRARLRAATDWVAAREIAEQQRHAVSSPK